MTKSEKLVLLVAAALVSALNGAVAEGVGWSPLPVATATMAYVLLVMWACQWYCRR